MKYAISGSIAKSLYGLPTISKDVDVLAEHTKPIAEQLHPQFTVLAEEDAYQDVSGFVVELFTARSSTEREMLDRAREHRLGPETVRVLDPTDWAAIKLRYAREVPPERLKHLGDVQAVAQVQAYDCARLRRLVKEFRAEREFTDAGVCGAPGD